MKRTQKRALSLIMTLALLLGLVPAMSIPAAAAPVTSVTVGGAALNSTTPYAVAGADGTTETTTGATDKIHNVAFESTTGTLTLSGVNLTSDIAFTGDAKIVLEGTNKITGTISCTGSLMIEGSGTLDVAPTTGSGISATSLTISSGYVTVTDSADTAVSVTGTMTVSGGYFVATSTSSSGSGISAATLSVTGGYVKATGGNTYAGVTSTTVTVSGGYLEASGAAGITGDVANSNGVIKAAGTAGNGITGTANCTGGVTIANGTGVAAISGNITGDSSELLFDNTAASINATGATLAASNLTGVVIAKKVSTTQLADASLDGAYIYVTKGYGWKPTYDATVAGGSYIYSNVDSSSSDADGCYPQAGLTVEKTLVVAGAGGGIYSLGSSITVTDKGNLITPNKTGVSSNRNTPCTLTNSGNIVTDTIYTGISISEGTINQNGGSIVSVASGTGTSLEGISAKEFNVTGGCVTAYAPNTLGIFCFDLTQKGGAVTAVSASNSYGITYDNLGGQTTHGAITVPDGKAVLGSADLYGSLKKTYRKGAGGQSYICMSLSSFEKARVVFLSGDAPDPTVNVTAADSTALTAGDTSTTKTYNVTAKNIGRLYEVTYSSTISTIKWYSDIAAVNDITVTNVAITKPASGTVGTFGSLKTVLEGTTPALSATIGTKQSAGTTPDTSKDSTVVVDGKPVSAGKVTTSTNSDGTKNNNVAVDSTILEKQVAVADNGSSVIVTVPVSTGSASAQLVVKDVEKLDAKDMPLEIKVGDTNYTIAPNAIDTAKVAAELGATDTGKVPLTVTVTPVKQSDVSVSKGTQIAEPVKFTVTAEYNGKTVAVDSFNRFVSRLIEIPENVAANMITTGIRVEDGEHVPTEVIQQGGRYFAKINSLTNSTYTVIYNKAGFADTVGKWYNDVVTEMASRTIVNGKTSTVFDGDGSITRAEFAAILVRALGLPEGKTSQFSDTAKSAWYYGSVSTATQYGIIKGYLDGSFKPGANITREEAMAMMQRAAKVAGYAGTTGTLTGFSDASSVGAWAKSAVAYNVGSGLIQGNAGKLNPKNSITRAETAVVVLRLLQKAKLVDVRTKA